MKKLTNLLLKQIKPIRKTKRKRLGVSQRGGTLGGITYEMLIEDIQTIPNYRHEHFGVFFRDRFSNTSLITGTGHEFMTHRIFTGSEIPFEISYGNNFQHILFQNPLAITQPPPLQHRIFTANQFPLIR